MRKIFILLLLVVLVTPVFSVQAVTDVCPNIAGDQATVPSGYHLQNGNCVLNTSNGNPMDAPCFSELGFGSCAEKLVAGLIQFLFPGETGEYGVCEDWMPTGCLEIVPNAMAPAIIHQSYGETSHGYTCDYLVGCELDLSLI